MLQHLSAPLACVSLTEKSELRGEEGEDTVSLIWHGVKTQLEFPPAHRARKKYQVLHFVSNQEALLQRCSNYS